MQQTRNSKRVRGQSAKFITPCELNRYYVHWRNNIINATDFTSGTLENVAQVVMTRGKGSRGQHGRT